MSLPRVPAMIVRLQKTTLATANTCKEERQIVMINIEKFQTHNTDIDLAKRWPLAAQRRWLGYRYRLNITCPSSLRRNGMSE